MLSDHFVSQAEVIHLHTNLWLLLGALAATEAQYFPSAGSKAQSLPISFPHGCLYFCSQLIYDAKRRTSLKDTASCFLICGRGGLGDPNCSEPSVRPVSSDGNNTGTALLGSVH